MMKKIGFISLLAFPLLAQAWPWGGAAVQIVNSTKDTTFQVIGGKQVKPKASGRFWGSPWEWIGVSGSDDLSVQVGEHVVTLTDTHQSCSTHGWIPNGWNIMVTVDDENEGMVCSQRDEDYVSHTDLVIMDKNIKQGTYRLKVVNAGHPANEQHNLHRDSEVNAAF